MAQVLGIIVVLFAIVLVYLRTTKADMRCGCLRCSQKMNRNGHTKGCDCGECCKNANARH